MSCGVPYRDGDCQYTEDRGANGESDYSDDDAKEGGSRAGPSFCLFDLFMGWRKFDGELVVDVGMMVVSEGFHVGRFSAERLGDVLYSIFSTMWYTVCAGVACL